LPSSCFHGTNATILFSQDALIQCIFDLAQFSCKTPRLLWEIPLNSFRFRKNARQTRSEEKAEVGITNKTKQSNPRRGKQKKRIETPQEKGKEDKSS
jgi:hypothetical protein